MRDFKYLEGVATLKLNEGACVGCGMCVTVCPHRVFGIVEKKTEIMDFDACMECGACAQNCPVEAINVTPGVGCASYIIALWLSKLAGRKAESVRC